MLLSETLTSPDAPAVTVAVIGGIFTIGLLGTTFWGAMFTSGVQASAAVAPVTANLVRLVYSTVGLGFRAPLLGPSVTLNVTWKASPGWT